jgi:hypothetical protein
MPLTQSGIVNFRPNASSDHLGLKNNFVEPSKSYRSVSTEFKLIKFSTEFFKFFLRLSAVLSSVARPAVTGRFQVSGPLEKFTLTDIKGPLSTR